jgi:hypothetical protein
MSNPIQEKIWNIQIVVEEIKLAPQTYETILKGESRNGTLLTILRRKLSRLVKDGIICKTTIPATRYSRIIYYSFPKKYSIIFETSRFGSNVFYFNTFNRKQKFYIEVPLYYELLHDCWVEKYNKRFFEGDVLRML